MPLNIIDTQTFSTLIKERIRRNKCTTLEAIVDHCEENEMDPEIAATLIDAEIYSNLQDEAKRLHLIEPIETLPFA